MTNINNNPYSNTEAWFHYGVDMVVRSKSLLEYMAFTLNDRARRPFYNRRMFMLYNEARRLHYAYSRNHVGEPTGQRSRLRKLHTAFLYWANEAEMAHDLSVAIAEYRRSPVMKDACYVGKRYSVVMMKSPLLRRDDETYTVFAAFHVPAIAEPLYVISLPGNLPVFKSYSLSYMQLAHACNRMGGIH